MSVQQVIAAESMLCVLSVITWFTPAHITLKYIRHQINPLGKKTHQHDVWLLMNMSLEVSLAAPTGSSH